MNITDLTPAERHLITEARVRLIATFEQVLPREQITRIIDDSTEQLLRRATITSYIPVLAERFATERLTAAARTADTSRAAIPSVLFLCVHNAGRSQMAAAWLRHLAGDRVAVHSGGSDPGEHVNPAVIQAMAEVGIDLDEAYPKPWTDEVLRGADVVVTMGCGDECPILPGIRYEDWELEDPAGQGVEAVRLIRDDIRTRVEMLVATLGLPDEV